MGNSRLVIAAVVLVAACGGTTSSTSGTVAPTDGVSATTGSTCNDLASAAQKDVAAVLEAHLSCTQASDCKVTIPPCVPPSPVTCVNGKCSG